MSKAQKLNMSPEEKIRRGIIAKMRFRAAIRMVIANLGWIGDVETQELGDDVQMNVAVLTKSSTKSSLLTIKEKSIMMKPAEDRTDEEKKHLNRVIGGFKCFRRYPSVSVKAQLAAVAYFRYYNANRTIFYQDGPPQAIYFVLTGELQSLRKGFDPVLNQKMVQGTLNYGPGSVIGDISCLHDKPRTADLITLTPCELLLLKKSDFDVILKATIQEEWNEMIRAMSHFSYFDSWKAENITDCVLMMKIVTFKPEQRVLGRNVGFKDCVYFLCEGKVQIIEDLDVNYTTYLGKKHYNLFTKDASIVTDERKDSQDAQHLASVELASVSADRLSSSMISSCILRPLNFKKKFMQVCILHKSACFNIGENLANRSVVAMTPSKCMLIPRYWLTRTNVGNIWNKVRTYLERHIPNRQQVFKKFVKEHEWREYRSRMVEDVLKDRKVSGNHCSNVPYSIRMQEAVALD